MKYRIRNRDIDVSLLSILYAFVRLSFTMRIIEASLKIMEMSGTSSKHFVRTFPFMTTPENWLVCNGSAEGYKACVGGKELDCSFLSLTSVWSRPPKIGLGFPDRQGLS